MLAPSNEAPEVRGSGLTSLHSLIRIETTMKKRFPTLGTALACLVILAGCGGGGGGGGGSSVTPSTVTSTNAFPLQDGFQKRIAAGASDKFTVEDFCTGTSTITYSTPVPDSFETVQGYSVTQTASATYTNCAPSPITVTVTNHYDTHYTLIGTTSSGGQYVRFVPPAPAALPTSVKVGDTGTMVTMNTYTSSSQTILTGKRVLSYEIEPDTASTAIFDLITQDFDTNDVVKITEHSLYRMAADGTLTLLYIDVQYSPPDSRHLLYTRVP